jgi:hypothetical protein
MKVCIKITFRREQGCTRFLLSYNFSAGKVLAWFGRAAGELLPLVRGYRYQERGNGSVKIPKIA